MSGCPDKTPATPITEADVDFFERAEKAGERLLQMNGTTPCLAEIARPELVLMRNDGGPERPVFMRSLRPGEVRIAIDPESESHISS